MILFIHSVSSLAQDPGDFGDDDPDENPTDEPSAPIDGGIYYLALAAVFLSTHTLIKHKAKAQN